MNTLRRTIFLGLILGIGTTATAEAGGELLMPPADDYKSPVTAYHDTKMMPKPRRVYLRGDIGWAHHDEPDMIEDLRYYLTDEEIDDTFTFGVGIGRYFSPKVRGDVTVDYRTDTAVTAFMPAGGASILANTSRDADLSSLVVLANLYYDFNTHNGVSLRKTRWTPYVGVGLGFVTHWSDDGTFTGAATGTIGDNSETHVAGALMTGVALNIRNHWKIDAGYRFLYLGDYETGNVIASGGSAPGAGKQKVENIHAHEFRLGVRYDLR